MATFAGHLTEPPRDRFGRPIPSATFQLYIPGTKTAPTYYTNRLKSGTVSGDPSSDSRGNVDRYAEAGIYEYWYDGAFIQTWTIEEDNEEDNATVAAAVAEINAQLALMPTLEQMNEAIASGGGPTVGAELLIHKNVAGGYAGLSDPGGLVDNAHLPTSATSGARTPTAHALSHEKDGSDEVAVFGIFREVVVTEDYTAEPGDLVICDQPSGDDYTVTLPLVGNLQSAVMVKIKPGVLTNIQIAGDIDGALGTIAMSPWILGEGVYSAPSKIFGPGETTWYTVAEHDQRPYVIDTSDLDLHGFALSDYLDVVNDVTADTHEIGGVVGSTAMRYRYTNPAGCEVTLSGSADRGATVVCHRKGGVVTFVVDGDGTLTDPDGNDSIVDVDAQISLYVETNENDTDASWVMGGRSG